MAYGREFYLGGQVMGAGRNWGILKRSTFFRRSLTLLDNVPVLLSSGVQSPPTFGPSQQNDYCVSNVIV